MALSFFVSIKDFFGIYVITPFEQELLKSLNNALSVENRQILAYQLAHFTTIRRLIKHIDIPRAHGFTNFYTLRFGKSVDSSRQKMRFKTDEAEALLAVAHVVFEEGEIEVKFLNVTGVLFRFEYRSPQKIYYPPHGYRVESMIIKLKT